MIGKVLVVRKGGWLPKDAVRRYVGRPSLLGNPFSHLPSALAEHKVATRGEAVHRHAAWLRGLPRSSPQWEEIGELADLVSEGGTVGLECWCGDNPPPGHCHAVTIAAEVMRLARREVSP